MVRNHVSGLPVVDDVGAIVGMLSEGDLLRRIELGTAQAKEGFWTRFFTGGHDAERYRRARGRRVYDVMTENAITVDAKDTLADAARLMQHFKIKRLPVVMEGQLVGMLTRGDFAKVLGQLLAPTYDDTIVSDDEIAAKIRQEIARHDWSANCSVEVACENGKVTMSGYAPTETQRRAMIVAAETADGVRAINDCIIVYEPVPLVGM